MNIRFRANTGFNAPLALLEFFSNRVNEPPRWKVEDFLTGFTFILPKKFLHLGNNEITLFSYNVIFGIFHKNASFPLKINFHCPLCRRVGMRVSNENIEPLYDL